jgi:3-methyladenine DNA glycosylase Mpg
MNGHDLTIRKKLFIASGKLRPDERIARSTRIGVSPANTQLWRFFVAGSGFTSRRQAYE